MVANDSRARCSFHTLQKGTAAMPGRSYKELEEISKLLLPSATPAALEQWLLSQRAGKRSLRSGKGVHGPS